MIYTISETLFQTKSPVMLGFVYFFVILGLFMMILYILRVIVDPAAYIREDFSSPAKIATVGAFSMATCLLGKAIRINELDFPSALPATIVYTGSVIQVLSMIPFLVSCWRTSTWSEPYWNNAVHSCLFAAVCLGGDDRTAVIVRIISLSVGFIFLAPNVIIMVIRVLRTHEKQEDIVANNPTIAMLQAACSITCAGWLTSPLTSSAVTGIGGSIGHTLFAFSTFGFIVSVIGIWQRRIVLYNDFVDSPLWVAFTFPFANTAITAGIYGKLHPTYSYVLSVWILILSAIAGTFIIAVDILFIKKGFFLYKNIPEKKVCGACEVTEDEASLNFEVFKLEQIEAAPDEIVLSTVDDQD